MRHFFLLLAISFAFFSCSSDDQVDNSSDTLAKKGYDYISKIEVYVYPQGYKQGEYVFTYDNQKRLLTFCDDLFHNTYGPPRVATVTYTDSIYSYTTKGYITGRIVLEDHRGAMYLDKQGRATKFINEAPYKDPLTDEPVTAPHTKDSLIYDADGHLTSSYIHEINLKNTFKWENNDLVKATVGGKGKITYGNTFVRFEYTNVPNRTFPDLNIFRVYPSIFNRNEGIWTTQTGIRSAHLVAKRHVFYDNKLGKTNTDSYKFDDKGRPIELMENDVYYGIRKYVITYLDK